MFVLDVDGVVEDNGTFVEMIEAAHNIKYGMCVHVRAAREGDSVGEEEFIPEEIECANEEDFDVLPDLPPSGWIW